MEGAPRRDEFGARYASFAAGSRHAAATAGPAGDEVTHDIAIGAFAGLTILVVEDDPVTREGLEQILTFYGARVATADSLRTALHLYEQMAPAVVISDIGLTQGDGYMLVRAIRTRDGRRGRRTPAIAVSGLASREGRNRALQAGFDAFVSKPVDVHALLNLTRSLVSV